MNENIQKFKDYLEIRFPNLKDIKHTFQECSKDDNHDNSLVNSQIRTINFDKLTKWYRQPAPQSADSLSFSDKFLYLIEFKAGDPTSHSRKLDKLISGAIGKINDSDETLTDMYSEAFGDDTRLKQRFCLVVDSKQMGIMPIVSTLTTLSLSGNGSVSEKERIMFEKVKPELEQGVVNDAHYSGIEIWYSELFDKYLGLKKICSSVEICA